MVLFAVTQMVLLTGTLRWSCSYTQMVLLTGTLRWSCSYTQMVLLTVTLRWSSYFTQMVLLTVTQVVQFFYSDGSVFLHRWSCSMQDGTHCYVARDGMLNRFESMMTKESLVESLLIVPPQILSPAK